jgi:hypothetical protein
MWLGIRKHLRKIVTSTIVIGLLIGIPTGMYSLSLALGTINVSANVFQSIVDADAALLGFLGIIAVFALARYNDTVHLVEEQVYRTNLEHQQEIVRAPETNVPDYLGETQTLAGADHEYEIYKKRLKQLESRINKMRKNSKSACMMCVCGASFFIASIFCSLLAMSEITEVARFFATYFAASTCILGVVWIFFIVLGLRDVD